MHRYYLDDTDENFAFVGIVQWTFTFVEHVIQFLIQALTPANLFRKGFRNIKFRTPYSYKIYLN